MTNLQLAKKVVDELIQAGVREFCLCAGARNSPLVFLLENGEDIKVYNFFEERSAAFFALGRIAATDLPVAVITTSGTAVAELLPAAVEATYSSLPLILISADRPKTYRGSGAPQTVEQVGMFSYYIEATFDLDEENSHISLKSLTYKKPIHINVCFKEPLLEGEVPVVSARQKTFPQRFPESVEMNELREVSHFLETHKPVVIVGSLPAAFRKTVVQFLKRLKMPIYAEAISGLRNEPEIAEFVLKSGEKIVNHLIETQSVNAVMRIGGVPTLRFWRDLEDKYDYVPVLSLSYNYYTGLSRQVQHFADIHCLESVFKVEPARSDLDLERWKSLRGLDDKMSGVLMELMNKYPTSEPSLVHQLSERTSSQSVYLGNSLPIREWDLCSQYRSLHSRIYANRGANGIDGQLSTFLGWCREDQENWCVVGDLTALYDLSAPWIVPQLDTKKFRIVIINNGGGQIFKRVFKNDIFLNRHEVGFKDWASMWGWSYKVISQMNEMKDLEDRQVLELRPNEGESEKFWEEWDRAWKNIYDKSH